VLQGPRGLFYELGQFLKIMEINVVDLKKKLFTPLANKEKSFRLLWPLVSEIGHYF